MLSQPGTETFEEAEDGPPTKQVCEDSLKTEIEQKVTEGESRDQLGSKQDHNSDLEVEHKATSSEIADVAASELSVSQAS